MYEYLILSKQIPLKSNVTKMNSSEIILLNFAVKTFPLPYQNFNMEQNTGTSINPQYKTNATWLSETFENLPI